MSGVECGVGCWRGRGLGLFRPPPCRTDVQRCCSAAQYSICKEAKPSRGGLATSCPVDFWLIVWFKTRPVSAVIVLPQA